MSACRSPSKWSVFLFVSHPWTPNHPLNPKKHRMNQARQEFYFFCQDLIKIKHTAWPSRTKCKCWLSKIASFWKNPTIEYPGTVWDPYCSKRISSIKKVQRRAALPVLNKHRNCWWHAPPVEMAVLSMLMMNHLAGWPCFTRYPLDKYVRCLNLKPKEGKEKAPQPPLPIFLLLHWLRRQHIFSLHNQRMEWAPSKLPWHLHIKDIIIPTANTSTSLPHPLFFCSLFFFSAAQSPKNDSKG